MPNDSELDREIAFGLENLAAVYDNIVKFSDSEVDLALKTSAVAYECLGYYNAAEHLMIRILKAAGREIPTGAFSHRDILKAFRAVVEERELGANDALTALETLMAFRHVATKIYGFLIDWQKLRSVVADIREYHLRFAQMFRDVAAGSSSG